MTVSELAAELVANAENLNGEPLDATEALVRKMAQIAEHDGVSATGLNLLRDDRFTFQDRQLCTPALMERAERMRQEQTKATIDKASKPAKKVRMPLLPKRADGYYLDASEETPDVPEYGPYDTKREAEEARTSYIRSNPAAKPEKAKKSGSKKKSEPSPVEPGHDDAQADVAQGDNTTPSESENSMKTDNSTKSKKKAKGTSAKASKGAAKAAKPAKAPKGQKKAAAAGDKPSKPAKAPKAAKEPKVKKVGCLDAAHQVLKGRSNPMSPQELIDVLAERKLWSSPGGKTPSQTLRAALDREIKTKGKDSRFCKPEAGKFSAA